MPNLIEKADLMAHKFGHALKAMAVAALVGDDEADANIMSPAFIGSAKAHAKAKAKAMRGSYGRIKTGPGRATILNDRDRHITIKTRTGQKHLVFDIAKVFWDSRAQGTYIRIDRETPVKAQKIARAARKMPL